MCHNFSNRNTQADATRKGTPMLVQLTPEHEINLRCAPYELVPGFLVNSLPVLMTDVVSEGSGEHVRLHNLVRV